LDIALLHYLQSRYSREFSTAECLELTIVQGQEQSISLFQSHLSQESLIHAVPNVTDRFFFPRLHHGRQLGMSQIPIVHSNMTL
jgi:hypothetical protein